MSRHSLHHRESGVTEFWPVMLKSFFIVDSDVHCADGVKDMKELELQLEIPAV